MQWARSCYKGINLVFRLKFWIFMFFWQLNISWYIVIQSWRVATKWYLVVLSIWSNNAPVAMEHSAITRVLWLAVCFLLLPNRTISNQHIRLNLAIGAVKSAIKLPQVTLYTLKTCIKSTDKSLALIKFCNVPLGRMVRQGVNNSTSACHFCTVTTVQHITI